MTKLCQIKGYTNVKAIRPFHEFKLIYSKYVYVYKYILYMCHVCIYIIKVSQ